MTSLLLASALLVGAATVSAMPITGTLTQGNESEAFDLRGGQCYAFSVRFEGGKKKKFKVAVTDSRKGLSYIAAGVGRYNNDFVSGGPLAFQGCEGSDFDGLSARPQCWGDSWTDVETSGYITEDDTIKCSEKVFPYKMQAGADEDFDFKFRSSDGAKCKTEDGTYFLYVYADSDTTVTFDVTKGNVKKSSCKNEQVGGIVALIILILICCCCCAAIAGGIFFCIKSQQNKPPHNSYTTEVNYTNQTPAQQYSQAQDWGTSQPYGQPQPGPPQVGQGSAAQPLTGTVVGGPQVVQGTVIGGTAASAPNGPPPTYGDAPPAYGS